MQFVSEIFEILTYDTSGFVIVSVIKTIYSIESLINVAFETRILCGLSLRENCFNESTSISALANLIA